MEECLEYLCLTTHSLFAQVGIVLMFVGVVGLLSSKAESRLKKWIHRGVFPLGVVLLFAAQYGVYVNVSENLETARGKFVAWVYDNCSGQPPSGPVVIPELNLGVVHGDGDIVGTDTAPVLFAVPADPSASIEEIFAYDEYYRPFAAESVEWIEVLLPRGVPTQVDLGHIGKILVELKWWCAYGTHKEGIDGIVISLTRAPK